MYVRQCDWCGKVIPAENYEDYVKIEAEREDSSGRRPDYYHLCNRCYIKFKEMKVK